MIVIAQIAALRRSAMIGFPLVRSNTPRPRVMQGQTDHKNEYPYVVTLETRKSQHPDYLIFRKCTGSLIASQWVLTAAHCIKPRVKLVRYGDMTITRKETKYLSKVLKQIPHPSYFGGRLIRHDIGLLLVEEIHMKKFGRLHAADYKTFIGRACRYAGFGITDVRVDMNNLEALEEDNQRPLQLGEGAVVSGNEYFKQANPMLLIVPRCDSTNQNPSNGDSGGPLFIDKYIVGVCSQGYRRNKLLQATYTPVSPYLNWIARNIADHVQ